MDTVGVGQEESGYGGGKSGKKGIKQNSARSSLFTSSQVSTQRELLKQADHPAALRDIHQSATAESCLLLISSIMFELLQLKSNQKSIPIAIEEPKYYSIGQC